MKCKLIEQPDGGVILLHDDGCRIWLFTVPSTGHDGWNVLAEYKHSECNGQSIGTAVQWMMRERA